MRLATSGDASTISIVSDKRNVNEKNGKSGSFAGNVETFWPILNKKIQGAPETISLQQPIDHVQNTKRVYLRLCVVTSLSFAIHKLNPNSDL